MCDENGVPLYCKSCGHQASSANEQAPPPPPPSQNVPMVPAFVLEEILEAVEQVRDQNRLLHRRVKQLEARVKQLEASQPQLALDDSPASPYEVEIELEGNAKGNAKSFTGDEEELSSAS